MLPANLHTFLKGLDRLAEFGNLAPHCPWHHHQSSASDATQLRLGAMQSGCGMHTRDR